MSSQFQSSGNAFSEILPFPEGRGWLGRIYPEPVSPGIYGNNPLEMVVIATNNRPILVELGKRGTVYAVLAMDAGGFAPQAAAAFGTVDRRQMIQVLGNLKREGTIKEPGIVIVPRSLAQALSIMNGSEIGVWVFRICKDDYSNIADSNQELEKNGIIPGQNPGKSFILYRLIAGFELWLGQALIAAIPLLIFSWQSLILGECALLAASLFLALLWGLLPGLGWVKGIFIGALFVAGAGATGYLILGLPLNMLWLPLLGIFLGAVWMGIILMGSRAKKTWSMISEKHKSKNN